MESPSEAERRLRHASNGWDLARPRSTIRAEEEGGCQSLTTGSATLGLNIFERYDAQNFVEGREPRLDLLHGVFLHQAHAAAASHVADFLVTHAGAHCCTHLLVEDQNLVYADTPLESRSCRKPPQPAGM